MNNKQILSDVIEALGIKSVQEFSMKLGYKSPSYIYREVKDNDSKSLNKTLCYNITKVFPQINLKYLRSGKGEVIDQVKHEFFKNSDSIGEMKNTDMSTLILLKLVERQEKSVKLHEQTNTLLKDLIEKLNEK